MSAHRLVAVLAVTNIVTLLGFTICLTVLVVNGMHGTYRAVQSEEAALLAKEVEILRAQYEAALAGRHPGEGAFAPNSSNDPFSPSPIGARTPSNPTASASSSSPPPHPRPTAAPTGLAAWRLLFVNINRQNPLRSEAHVENRATPLAPVRRLQIGDTIENWRVVGIEPDRVRLLDENDAEGFLLRVSDIHAHEIGPREPINTPETPIDLDRLTGQSSPSVPGNNANANANANAASGRRDEGGNLRPVEGVRSETVDDGKTMVIPDSANLTDPSAIDRAPDGAVVQTHMLAPELVYELATNHAELLARVVVEGVYDPSRGEFTGAKIVFLPSDSPFALHGFKLDDVIVRVNGRVIHTGADIEVLWETVNFTSGGTVVLMRHGRPVVLRFIYSADDFQAFLKNHALDEQRKRELLERALGRGADADSTAPPADPRESDDAAPTQSGER